MAYGDEGSVTERMDRPQKTGRQVKDRKKKKKEGGNPNVPAGAFGGEEDYGGESQGVPQNGNFDFARALYDLMRNMPPQENASEFITTKAQLADPEKFARDQYMAKTYAAPFSGEPGAAFTGRQAADLLTPEEIMASQGRTAANQWASMRKPLTQDQKTAGEFDPEELRRLNQQYVGNRSYM